MEVPMWKALPVLFAVGGLCLADEKPVRYEFAELRYSRYSTSAPGGPLMTKTDIRWVTAEGEVQADGWAELAGKLNAADGKKEGTAGVHKMRVLNHLSAEGWEVVERPVLEGASAGGSAWQFRRRVR
jgi:hypothetical protein